MSGESLAPRLEQLERLLAEIERTADPAQLARTREIVSVVLELHAAGLSRMLELVDGGADKAGCARDPLVGSLLLLHGLHPLPLETRVREALAARFKAEEVVLLSVDEGVVRLQLAAPRLRAAAVEVVSAAAPDAVEIAVDAGDAPLISVEQLLAARPEQR